MVIMFDAFMTQGYIADKIKPHFILSWKNRRNLVEASFINVKFIASLE